MIVCVVKTSVLKTVKVDTLVDVEVTVREVTRVVVVSAVTVRVLVRGGPKRLMTQKHRFSISGRARPRLRSELGMLVNTSLSAVSAPRVRVTTDGLLSSSRLLKSF